MKIIYNGEFWPSKFFTRRLSITSDEVEVSNATYSLVNRGLAFGDGFFETFIFRGSRYGRSRLPYATHHLARMQRAAHVLHLRLPEQLSTVKGLTETIANSAGANGFSDARLRLQIWRSGGGRYTPETDVVDWLVTAEEFIPDNSPIVTAGFATATNSIYSPLSFCKGPQAWLYVRAAHERQQRGLDEIILCDAAGHVAEAGTAAIFWMNNGVLFTPSLETGCVAGVGRAGKIRMAQTLGIECREGLFVRDELLNAETAFTVNVASTRLILQLGNTKFQNNEYQDYRAKLLAYGWSL